MAVAVRPFSREALEEWIVGAVFTFPDIASGERSLGRMFIQGWRGEVKGSPDTLWEYKPLRPEDDWPSPESLVEASWGVLEDLEAGRWRKVRARATIHGGGECPSRTWSGEGFGDEELALEQFSEPRGPNGGPVGRIPRGGEMADVLGAIGEVVSSVQEFTKSVSQFSVIQNKALENREKLLMGQFGVIQYMSGQVMEARGETIEAQGLALAATEQASGLEARLQEEGTIAHSLGKAGAAIGHAVIGGLADTKSLRGRVVAGLQHASDEELAELAKHPGAQKLLERLMSKIPQTPP